MKWHECMLLDVSLNEIGVGKNVSDDILSSSIILLLTDSRDLSPRPKLCMKLAISCLRFLWLHSIRCWQECVWCLMIMTLLLHHHCFWTAADQQFHNLFMSPWPPCDQPITKQFLRSLHPGTTVRNLDTLHPTFQTHVRYTWMLCINIYSLLQRETHSLVK